MGKRDLSDPQATRVMARLRRRLQDRHEGNVLALSKELGYSQSALWQLLNDRTRPSLAMVEALAKAERVTVESILHSARERAAMLSREGGIPEAAIARVLAEPEPAQERPVLWWIARMQLAEQQLRLDAPPASTPVPTGAGARRSVA